MQDNSLEAALQVQDDIWFGKLRGNAHLQDLIQVTPVSSISWIRLGDAAMSWHCVCTCVSTCVSTCVHLHMAGRLVSGVCNVLLSYKPHHQFVGNFNNKIISYITTAFLATAPRIERRGWRWKNKEKIQLTCKKTLYSVDWPYGITTTVSTQNSTQHSLAIYPCLYLSVYF